MFTFITEARARRRATSAVAVGGAVLIASAVLSACGGGDADAGASGDDAKTIGIVNFAQSSITSTALTTALQAQFKGAGWTDLVQDANGETANANTICTQYVTRRVDAIVITVFEGSTMAQCSAKAKAADIPVFYAGDGEAADAAGTVSTVVPAPINDLFVKELGGSEKTDVLALTYNPGAPCRLREEDLDGKLAQAPNLTVEKHEVKVPGQVTDAKAATQAWLRSKAGSGNKLAIWACFQDPAIGALSALTEAKKTDVPVYTWDITKQTLQPLQSGRITDTLWINSPGMAEQMLGLIKGYQKGGEVQRLQSAATVLNSENIDGFVKDHADVVAN